MEKEESDEKSKKGIPVLVHLRSAGEAPGLKKPKLKIDGLKTVFEIEKYLRKQLRYDGSIYLFCGSGFSPTPDQLLQDLDQCFQSGGELAIHYGYQEAWG